MSNSVLFDLKYKSITDILPLLESEEESVLYQVVYHLAVNTKKDLDLCQSLSCNGKFVSLLWKTFMAHTDSNISLEIVRVIRNLIQNAPDIKDMEIWKTVVFDCTENLFVSEINAIQKSPVILLSILTLETQHAVQFARKDANLGLFVSEGFTSPDNELQHAVVQIMKNILLAVQADKKLEFDLDIIDVGSLIELYQSDYPVIAKTSLELTQLLLCCYSAKDSKSSTSNLSNDSKPTCEKDVGHRCGRHKYKKSGHKINTGLGLDFLEKLIEKEGWDILIQLLNDDELQDIHSSVFAVLSCLVRFPSTSNLITESLVDFLITYVSTCTENELCYDALSLIVKMAENPSREIKELLSQNETLADLILECIQDEECCFVGEGCALITLLILEDPIFDKISQEEDNVFSILCCIVNSEYKKCPWYIRVKAVSALSAMVLRDGEMCAKFVELHKTAVLAKWLIQDETAEDMVSELLHLLYLAYSKPKYLDTLPIDILDILSSGAFLQMKSTNADIQVKAARLYSMLFDRMWDLEPQSDSFGILNNLLVNASDGSEAQNLFADNIIIPLQIKYAHAPQHHYHVRHVVTQGTLHWLVQQSKTRQLPSILKELLDLIFDHHVSAKFAYYNEIPAKYNINSIRNKLPTSFYFYRNPRDYSKQRFRLLDELEEEQKNKTSEVEQSFKNDTSETEQIKNKTSETEQSKNKYSEPELTKNKISEEEQTKKSSEAKHSKKNKISKAEQSHSMVNRKLFDSGDLVYVMHNDVDTVFYNQIFYYLSPDHPCPSRSATFVGLKDSDTLQNMSDESSNTRVPSKKQLNGSEEDSSQTWSKTELSKVTFDEPIKSHTIESSSEHYISDWWWCTASNSISSEGSISSNHVPRFSDLTTYADIVLRTFSSTKRWTCYKPNICPYHSFHLYLCELMIHLNSIMVPFESLRFGRELECAVPVQVSM
ncbi:hypothetical protein WDU94_006331 [Cyamophila willieti]